MVARKLDILISAWSVAAKYPSRAATPEKRLHIPLNRYLPEARPSRWTDSCEVVESDLVATCDYKYSGYRYGGNFRNLILTDNHLRPVGS